MTRYSATDARRLITAVQASATHHGLTQLTYSGGTFEGLYLRQEYGTVWLSSTLDDGTGGASDVGNARGIREVVRHLEGMLSMLDAIRYNSD